MLDPNKITDEEIEFQKKATNEGVKFQKKIKGIFDKYHYLGIEVLDEDESGCRPDFFVFLKGNKEKGFICECKSVASAGVIDNGKYHVSILDKKLSIREKGGFQYNQYTCDTKIADRIKEALSQYQALVRDKPFYQKFPFVIALKFDFFADRFDYIFDLIAKYISEKEIEKISAVMRIERNIEQKEEFKNWSTEDLEKVIKGKRERKIPLESVRLKVLLNLKAKIKFKPKDFLKNPIVLYSKNNKK